MPRIYKRKYYLDDHFLDVIDSHEKAYILGFLYADGCNHTKKGMISIGLHYRDIEIIEGIKNYFNYEGPFYKDKNIRKLVLNSKHLSKTLESYGMVARKSLILKYPNKEIVPTQYENSFILGLFDGDGTIYKDKYKCTIGFSGSYDVLKGIQEYLVINCNVNINKIYPLKTIFTLAFPKREEVNRIRNILYKDSTFFLERKKKKMFDCECTPYKVGNYNRKLSEEEVMEIRRLLSESPTRKTNIAKRFNISPQILSQIRKGIKYNRF